MENNRFECDILTEWYSDNTVIKNFVVDIFPQRIDNPEKYYQCSVFYKKFLDKEISKACYLDYENRFVHFVKSLWLYNEVEIYCDLDDRRYFKKALQQKTKKALKHLKNGTILQIECFPLLEGSLRLALREAGYIYIFLKEYNILITVCDFAIKLSIKNLECLERIKSLLNTCLLHMWEDIDQSGDG